MIGKKIKNPNPRSSKAERIKKLTDYIREPKSKNSGERKEKCVYSGSRGFVCDDPKLQQSEMISLAMAATRSADPINHFVLSWREGECPNKAQIEEAVTIFMTECGLDGHMVVYGLHSDTDNFHLHLAINRVNPETEKAVRINNGFDIEAAHRAVARIVKAQGWKPEENALFFVDDKGVLVDTRVADRKNREQKPSSRAQDYEQRTGEKSAERIGIETLPDVLKISSNWDEFHTKMSEHGMRYEKKGSGAIIWVGEQAIKASAADRNASLSKLEKRFGEFTESKPIAKLEITLHLRSPQLLKEEFSVNYGWNDYAKERREYFAEKKAAKLEMNRLIDIEYKAMIERQRTERDNIYGNGSWKGKGIYLNAMRSVVAAQHAGEKAEFKERNKESRGELSRRFVPFPDFESWMRERGDEKGAELWRHRHEPKASVFSPDPWATPSLKVNVDIRAFGHRVDTERGRVDYFRERENANKPSFTDFGKRVEIADWRDESVTLAALQLSAQKWAKGFYVSGNDEYKEMCVRLAAEHGLKILNPELQENLEKVRAQRQQTQKIERKRLADEAVAAKKFAEEAQAEREKATEQMRKQQPLANDLGFGELPLSKKPMPVSAPTPDSPINEREQKGLEKFQTAQSLDEKIKKKQESVEEPEIPYSDCERARERLKHEADIISSDIRKWEWDQGNLERDRNYAKLHFDSVKKSEPSGWDKLWRGKGETWRRELDEATKRLEKDENAIKAHGKRPYPEKFDVETFVHKKFPNEMRIIDEYERQEKKKDAEIGELRKKLPSEHDELTCIRANPYGYESYQGEIVMVDGKYTIQKGSGENLVFHENKKLERVPQEGEDVRILYSSDRNERTSVDIIDRGFGR